MSHFVIAVLTQTGSEEEVAKLMAPYHEFECTGCDDQYVQDIDITEKVIAEFEAQKEAGDTRTLLEWIEYEYGRQPVPFGNTPDLVDKHKYGYVLLSEDTSRHGISKVVRRTNPNYFWDWWVIGGRWDNYFFQGNRCKVSEFPAWPDEWNAPNKFFGLITPDGAYHSKGRGGWWGTVHDEKETWPQEEAELLSKYPDAIAVVVDFHI